jgi:uncharacterized Tic20 family protein
MDEPNLAGPASDPSGAASATPAAAASTGSPTIEERNWAVVCHLSALAGLVVWVIGGVLGTLIVWLWKKEGRPFVDDQGREAVNFQLTVLIAAAFCYALVFVFIGVPLLIALGIFNLVCIVLAAIKASEGVAYRYPINLRLIK